ncbi:MAG TPA: aminopeptidase, partial [Planctomycetota bacterium]|nr:aminopeptidase [Planctomycetota bacterium]
MTHVDLDLDLDFARREISGRALLTVERGDPDAPLVVDTAGLTIEEVTVGRRFDSASGRRTSFDLGPPVPHLGQALTIRLPAGADIVSIAYRTAPDAAALQWLTPEQTHDRAAPFLYTQGQAILTRSWIPLQDSPSARV